MSWEKEKKLMIQLRVLPADLSDDIVWKHRFGQYDIVFAEKSLSWIIRGEWL